jgi:hypothetical protein
MSSIESLLTRAKRLHGINDDALEIEWNAMLDMEVEELLTDLEERIARQTPEEQAEEERNSIPLTPAEEAELNASLDANSAGEKAYWFAQQRKKRRRGRR